MKSRQILMGLGFILGTAGLHGAAISEGRGDELFRLAIEAMGGARYLEVRDWSSDGNYFFFDRHGRSSGLIRFVDYTKLPDKSRNELGNHKKRKMITVFNLELEQGWILEGQKETRDATPEEMRRFGNAVKHSIDVIFRYRYGAPDNKLFYLGPGEGSDVRLERVQLLDTENDEVVVFFDRMSHLPVKITYQTLSEDGVRLRHVDEFYQWHKIDGVLLPLRTDSFVNGRKASQIFTKNITLNSGLEDAFFSKPEPLP